MHSRCRTVPAHYDSFDHLGGRAGLQVAATSDNDEQGVYGTGMTDFNEIRDILIRGNNLTNADEPYTLYYDETNNLRRLHVTPGGLNVPEPGCFALGGIAHRGPPRALDIAGLRQAVQLQPSSPELKLEHLGKGSFLDLLKSRKLNTFLHWLSSADLFIHYAAMDPLYWSTVDIVDSILADSQLRSLRAHHSLLKNDLYTILRPDTAELANLYHRYEYPNVGAHRAEFMAELCDLLETREFLLEPFNYQMLKGVLEIGVRGVALPYLQDEKPNTLIDSFVDFFVERFTLFKNATHILDVERTIEKRLPAFALMDGGRPLQNYRFVDSKSEPGVQISDPVAGLIGKFITYLVQTDEETLAEDRAALTPLQTENLAALNALMTRSNAETPAFFHHVLSLRDMNRAAQLLEDL